VAHTTVARAIAYGVLVSVADGRTPGGVCQLMSAQETNAK
jgi:hypothetical protein